MKEEFERYQRGN